MNSRLRDGAALWTILTQHGKGVGVFNVPLTFPPDRLKELMISGMDAPQSSPFTYPAALQADIQEAIGNYTIDVNGFCADILRRLLPEQTYVIMSCDEEQQGHPSRV